MLFSSKVGQEFYIFILLTVTVLNILYREFVYTYDFQLHLKKKKKEQNNFVIFIGSISKTAHFCYTSKPVNEHLKITK